MSVDLTIVKVQKPEDMNVIIGQTHFIKTVEDIYEVLITAVPGIKFGIAFCEASGKRLIRVEGNDDTLKKIATDNMQAIGCGHSFFIALSGAYPINVLNQIKNAPEVCRIFCATANPVDVIIAATQQGRALLGVVDGFTSLGVETPQDQQDRKQLLRTIGYKL